MLPLVLICGLYSVMLHRLWTQRPGGRASAESIKNKKRVIKLVLAVVIMFALSWFPIQIILVLRSLKLYSNTPVSVAFQIISHILAYSNSCVNPILYAFLSEPFRRGFCAVITCIRPSGPHQNGYEMAAGAGGVNGPAAAGAGAGGGGPGTRGQMAKQKREQEEAAAARLAADHKTGANESDKVTSGGDKKQLIVAQSAAGNGGMTGTGSNGSCVVTHVAMNNDELAARRVTTNNNCNIRTSSNQSNS